MATVLIGTAIGATSAARVTAVRPRAGAGARAFAFGANNAVSPSRVAGLGRRGTVRAAVRASLGAEPACEEKPEARVISEDARASASRGEALKQVRTRPSSRVGATMAKNIANLERFSEVCALRLSDRPLYPRLPHPSTQFGLHAALVVGVTALVLAFPCASYERPVFGASALSRA